jgi:outer membrane protein OmpA-like peptidoglycan-associated protein
MKKILLLCTIICMLVAKGFAQTASSASASSSLKKGGELVLKLGAGKVKGGFYKPLSFAITGITGVRTLGNISSPTLKWGIMGGIDYNYYFNTYIGISGTADMFSNKYNVITASAPPFTAADIKLVSQKNQSNLFFGLGPIGRLPITNKLYGTLGLYAGVLMHKKNNYQADYAPTTAGAVQTTMVKFSSSKALSSLAVKGSARLVYNVSNKFGLSLGAEYIVPFHSAKQKADALFPAASSGYQVNLPSPTTAGNTQLFFNANYWRTPLTKVSPQFDPVAVPFRILAINLAVHLRFNGERTPRKPREPKSKCCGTCPVYGLAVTARDKYTKEILPNTDVAIKNKAGEVIKTGRTNAFGVIVFEKIVKDDYTIDAVLNNIALENSSVKSDELICDKVVQKEVIYADRNFIIKGKAFECNTNIPIPGINVTLENIDMAYKKSTMTDNDGNFLIQLPETGTYNLYARKANYLSQVEEVTSSNYNRDKNLFVKLEICAQKADCGKAINLQNILFDLDKYAIKDAAKKELNRLVRFMQDNPSVKVELSSHTDCRNTDAYNQTLSQNRANASVDYVVSQGIARDRLVGKGYGESKLLNRCADGVNCSEAEHSINRRTEMKVICPE